MTTHADVALYARVSTKDQNVETQLHALRGYCEKTGISSYEIYSDVTSGVAESRPRLNDLLTDLRDGKVKTIIIYKLDRLGRTAHHLAQLLSEFRNRGVRCISICDGFDTAEDTPMSRSWIKTLSMFCEMERDNLQTRILSGLARARAEGKTLGRPFGSKDKSPRSRSGYWLRYAGKTKKQRRLGKRNVTTGAHHGTS